MASRNLIWILIYSMALALLAGLMTWAKYRFLVMDHAMELYGLTVGVVFVALGIWMGLKLSRPKTIVRTETIVHTETVVREVPVPAVHRPEPDSRQLARLNISQREHEVLRYLAQGLSNDEIATQMFVSQNTVKTHLSNLYFKLEAKRRTQAVEKARALGLV